LDLEKLHAHEKYLVNLNVKIKLWNCNGTISKHVCEIRAVRDSVGTFIGLQESHVRVLHR